MFKKGDKVKFKAVNGEHLGLRYEVNPGDVGDVTYVDDTGWMFVDWHKEDEAAMRMWPEEVEIVEEGGGVLCL